MTGNKKRIFCGYCPMCGKENYVDVFEEDYIKHCENPGAKIIDIYPYLSDSDRELMISGVCNDCWDVIFCDEEEDQ